MNNNLLQLINLWKPCDSVNLFGCREFFESRVRVKLVVYSIGPKDLTNPS